MTRKRRVATGATVTHDDDCWQHHPACATAKVWELLEAYESGGQTHHPDCWRDHLACARKRILAQRRELLKVKSLLGDVEAKAAQWKGLEPDGLTHELAEALRAFAHMRELVKAVEQSLDTLRQIFKVRVPERERCVLLDGEPEEDTPPEWNW